MTKKPILIVYKNLIEPINIARKSLLEMKEKVSSHSVENILLEAIAVFSITRFESMISKIINPKNILEIGTYTGYSALCLAEGMQQNGKILTIDKNEELESFSKKYFEASTFNNQIQQIIGNALEIIPTINEKFDLVFIDADKSNYVNYFHLIIEKMNSGGIILSDNVLWNGKVIEKLEPNDIDTEQILKYNKLLNSDTRIETVLLPIRDGLTISRVK